MVNDDNAVTALCEAVARLGRHEFPVRVTPTVRAFLDELSERSASSSTPTTWSATLAKLGPLATHDRRHAAQHGEPDDARGRLQGQRDPRRGRRRTSTAASCPATRRSSSPTSTSCSARDVTREFVHHDIARRDHLRRRRSSTRWPPRCSPRTRARGRCPYMLSGGTDAKAFATLGIRCFGFAPLQLPADAGLRRDVPRRRRAGARSTRCSSACGCSTGSCAPADGGGSSEVHRRLHVRLGVHLCLHANSVRRSACRRADAGEPARNVQTPVNKRGAGARRGARVSGHAVRVARRMRRRSQALRRPSG